MLNKLWNLIRIPFSNRFVGFKGAWIYYENSITGKRFSSKAYNNIIGPKDERWLKGLEDELHRPEYNSNNL